AYECANQYAVPSGSTGAHPIRGTRPWRMRAARPGTRPSPATPPSSSLSSSARWRPRQMPSVGPLRVRSASSQPVRRSDAIAVRADVAGEPAGLREAAQHVRRESRIRLDRELRPGAPAEIDGRAGERVVHRHDGVAVARDAAALAQGAVERLAERERGVFGGVV